MTHRVWGTAWREGYPDIELYFPRDVRMSYRQMTALIAEYEDMGYYLFIWPYGEEIESPALSPIRHSRYIDRNNEFNN